MTTLAAMYDGQANSPATTIATLIDNDDTTISVADASILPAATTWLVLGADTDTAETVLMTNKVSNDLTVTRAQQGTAAKSWGVGTKVQRCFTASDQNVLIDNIETLNTDKQEKITASGLLKGDGSGGVSAASAGTDYQVAISASGILKGAGSGSVSAATAGTDYQAAISASGMLKGAGSGSVSAATEGTDYIGADGNSKVKPERASAYIVSVTDSKTLALTDAGTFQYCTNSGAATITIPKNTTVDFPAGTEIEISRCGAGTVTIAGATDVVVRCKESTLAITDQYTCASIKKVDTNTWLLVGNVG